MEFEKEPLDKMSFTNHVLERYVERTMGKTGNELKQFLAQNSDQIKNKILKLYEYSELLWYGKIKDNDFTYFTINRDGWVIVIDKNKTKLITIYQVDLGLGNEFNKEYIGRIKDFVSEELNGIEEMKNQYSIRTAETNAEMEKIKEKNKLLQAEIDFNNSTLKLAEDTKKNEMEAISLREKQLHKKIEGFIGAKIF